MHVSADVHEVVVAFWKFLQGCNLLALQTVVMASQRSFASIRIQYSGTDRLWLHTCKVPSGIMCGVGVQ